MDFPITINFKHLDKILLRLEYTKKGTVFMPFLMSVLCFLSDWFLLRHYVADSLFLSIFRLVYVLAGLICFTVWLTKLYNELCDIKDEKKQEKVKQQEKELFIKNTTKLYLPVFRSFSDYEISLLKRFIDEKSTKVIFDSKDLASYSSLQTAIHNKFFTLGIISQIVITTGIAFSMAEISEEFYEILEGYFLNL